ncbi:hypothetical protein BZG36_04741 [Bifiguratus adelaidae]|uniref:N-acetyltransferase domain-containing protein n=1 Tax=Bifiguratus adelaidae TaxID=1938954 RepID=A0A261XUT7_9FUNG|nr:hypothetical protein BZG36_04741 [Bifiguratus adelaidae]
MARPRKTQGTISFLVSWLRTYYSLVGTRTTRGRHGGDEVVFGPTNQPNGPMVSEKSSPSHPTPIPMANKSEIKLSAETYARAVRTDPMTMYMIDDISDSKYHKISKRWYKAVIKAAYLNDGMIMQIDDCKDASLWSDKRVTGTCQLSQWDPEFQGRGYGKEVLVQRLAEADKTRTTCYLESSRGTNVPFYEKLGIRVIDKVYVG